MKKIISAVLLFSVMSAAVSCSGKTESDQTQPLTANITEETSFSSSQTVTSRSTVSRTTVTTAPFTSRISSSSVSGPDYDSIERRMLEEVGDPDYNGEIYIPYVGWTEVNLNRTMYPVSTCTGYEFALEDAAPKMRYGAGIPLEVIARTSTGYYRIEGDLYIPCDFLDTYVHDGIDQALATSSPVVTLAVSVTSQESDVTEPEVTEVTEEETEEYEYWYDDDYYDYYW